MLTPDRPLIGQGTLESGAFPGPGNAPADTGEVSTDTEALHHCHVSGCSAAFTAVATLAAPVTGGPLGAEVALEPARPLSVSAPTTATTPMPAHHLVVVLLPSPVPPPLGALKSWSSAVPASSGRAGPARAASHRHGRGDVPCCASSELGLAIGLTGIVLILVFHVVITWFSLRYRRATQRLLGLLVNPSEWVISAAFTSGQRFTRADISPTIESTATPHRPGLRPDGRGRFPRLPSTHRRLGGSTHVVSLEELREIGMQSQTTKHNCIQGVGRGSRNGPGFPWLAS